MGQPGDGDAEARFRVSRAKLLVPDPRPGLDIGGEHANVLALRGEALPGHAQMLLHGAGDQLGHDFEIGSPGSDELIELGEDDGAEADLEDFACVGDLAEGGSGAVVGREAVGGKAPGEGQEDGGGGARTKRVTAEFDLGDAVAPAPKAVMEGDAVLAGIAQPEEDVGETDVANGLGVVEKAEFTEGVVVLVVALSKAATIWEDRAGPRWRSTSSITASMTASCATASTSRI